MAAPTFSTNGSTNGYTTGASSADEAIDQLYAWMPPLTTPQPCPEAAFSVTLKGLWNGVDALLTVRGQTAAEFTRNLQAMRGVLDAPAAPPAQGGQATGKDWCAVHQTTMTLNQKDGRSWYSHKTADGFCKGKGVRV